MGQRTASAVVSEKELRDQIQRAVGRALVDREFAAAVLSDPTLMLGTRSCPDGQYYLLRDIHATDLMDFIGQVHTLLSCGASPLTWASLPALAER
jgi:hypothetical protein